MEPNSYRAKIRNGYDANATQRPSGFIISEVRSINSEMSKLCLAFSGVCVKIENCIRNINNYAKRADRELFQAFFNVGVAPGRYVRFIGTKDPNQIFYCSGMDGSGFYFRPLNEGREFYLDIFKHQNVASKIRLVHRNSIRGMMAGMNVDEHTLEPGIKYTPEGINTDEEEINKALEKEYSEVEENLDWLKKTTTSGDDDNITSKEQQLEKKG